MGFVRINKELQFRVCNHGQSWANFPNSKQRRTLLKREKGSWEGSLLNKESIGGIERRIVAFHWLSCDSFSLAEFLPSKKRKSFFSPFWAQMTSKALQLPLLASQLYFNWGLFIFTTGLSSFQSLSHVRLFATPWTTARQASLSITNSRSSLKLMSI